MDIGESKRLVLTRQQKTEIELLAIDLVIGIMSIKMEEFLNNKENGKNI
jgi:hypothetical protein